MNALIEVQLKMYLPNCFPLNKKIIKFRLSISKEKFVLQRFEFHLKPNRCDDGESIANMIVEIPRWTHAKLELTTTEELNPIKHVS